MTDIGWRKTFEESDNDYSAYDGGVYIGRIYLVTTSGIAPYWGYFPAKGGAGKAPSRREAMMKVEDAWKATASSSPAE